MSRLTARCPGKLIITGEHSVVYQQPAIALAVCRYSYASWQPSTSNALDVCLTDLDQQAHFANPANLNAQLAARHQAFLADQHPLPLCSATELVGATSTTGGTLAVRSELPTGSGMGSSASVIGACLKAQNADQKNVDLLAKATELENYQHGRSSGLDVRTCILGGVQTLNLNTRTQCDIPPALVIHTGPPKASTGEVVSFVRHQPASVWDDFGAVSQAIANAITNQFNQVDFFKAVKANHRLLCAIGVVPPAVQAIIKHIESLGGVAKIAGAGCHQGDQAGIIIAWGINKLDSKLPQFIAQPDWQGATLL
ncbi:mevalonate kinase family protein [Salinibius halmophilus]|uniref:mevalonate kinase family protein n=1 Tax=Salinibius halmophilus TaxID=1853216 RepID=UPI000E671218|nr:hypothetical protein [Salinibius halmophilus]